MSTDRCQLNAAAGRANQREHDAVPKGAGRRLDVVSVAHVHSTTRALSGSAVDKLTGGPNQLAKTLVCPGIKIVARVDWKFASLSECWAATIACILRQRRGHAWNAIGLANVARGVSTPHWI